MKRIIAAWLMCLLSFAGVVALNFDYSCAAATTITLKMGKTEYYGVRNYCTTWRWVTHINGEPVDLDDEPGVSRSYAYCVQPDKPTPSEGTYNVTVIDEDNTGRTAKMRKLIYYLPGGYGYTSVTKKKWFSKSVEGCSDYALGHIALSYLYDNCSGNSDAWFGTGDAVKSKVKDMIKELSSLPDPPEEFEVFWIKVDGYQDVFGAIYDTEYGKASVKKISSNTLISAGNNCYSLEGAQYTVYRDKACTEGAETKTGDKAVITVHSDGKSDEITVETGDYYIKETKAPRGYALDTDVHSIQITRDKTTVYSASDTPKSNPIDLIIQKVDRETGIGRAQGKASLKDAEFKITYYDVTPGKDMTDDDLRAAIKDKAAAKIKGKEAVWIMRTDEEGKINFADPEKYLIRERSADLYRDSKDRYVIPIGIITIEEISAPEGYKRNEELFIRAIRETGTVETLQTFKTLTDGDAVTEQVYRGDISFSKSADGGRKMKYIPFKISSVTTGESHIVFTDENGYANTASSWNAHTQNTNEGKSSWDGIWFNGYNDVETGAKAENRLAALPYDTYTIEELWCDSNEGYSLLKDTVTINRDSVLIDLGTFDDKPESEPEIHEVISSEHASPKHVSKGVETGDDKMPAALYYIAMLLAVSELALLTALRKNDRLNTENVSEFAEDQ